MSLNEIFDVFDEQMVKIGEASRQNVHAQGLWHQTFHCWVLSQSLEGELNLLLQLRHKDKDTYPNLLDISCAGHLLQGESVEDGVRELQEELGLTVPFDELQFCGVIKGEYMISETVIDREFNHIFIYRCNKLLEEYDFQKNEISGLFSIKLIDFQQLLSGKIDLIETEGIVFDETKKEIHNESRKIYLKDIVPNSDDYYKLLFDEISYSNERGAIK
ncbi:NUDIX domain-containing protein [Paenibacillus psychroresistens]|uniref:NUDIX domain-containing protein n=1 Tax=Paenibacillus psychroresistens TaxID=1778678 RepID=A0A6B8RIN7_9BACL|nr:NUDIX domain-containing protein [Paenibacillus psychroresistens]QGQ95465.1 NUDIX domain-containing protein [Paenibacillus psychroresistens]